MRPVGRDDHPGRLVAGLLERAPQPDEPAALEQLAVLLVERDLGGDRRPFGVASAVGSSSYPNAPKKATAARVSIGVIRPVWWFGTAATWAPIELCGYASEVPHWIRSRSIGVGVVAGPGLRRVGEHARGRTGHRRRRTTRTGSSGKARRQPRVQVVDAEDVAVEELALALGREGRLYGSVMVRFMSHLMYEIGALARTSDRAPKRWSTTSGRDMSRTSCWRLSVRGRPGMPIAQSGCASNRRLRSETISGSIQRPNLRPSASTFVGEAAEAVGQLAGVDEPVAERESVLVALAEPAVVEDEQLDAQVARRCRDREQLVGVEVEVGRPPSC